MTVSRTRRALIGTALLSVAVVGVGATPASANAKGQISPASSPRAKWLGQGENSGVGTSANPPSAAAMWTFSESLTFPGTYFLSVRRSISEGTLYLDLSGNDPSSGIPLVTMPFDGTKSQRWILEKQTGSSSRYRFKNSFANKYVTFDAAGGSAPLRIQPSNAFGEQRFDAPPTL
ncbi:RICIN domain-containing protein [Micromonospora sp. NPDC051141]|uniref:RICIN domain-containing protein n=1 Tax=Micromonospora sp. NPDC051141 TaxID=3364284 RepID=UPI00379796BF